MSSLATYEFALNSTSELEYHLLTARDMGAVREADSLTLVTQLIEVRKMLYGLLRYLAAPDRERINVAAKEATEV